MDERDYSDNCVVCGVSQSSAANISSEAFQLNNDAQCGHRFCQRCVDNQLNRKRSFACPKCKTPVSREKLSLKSLDDCEVEKDNKIRRRVKSIFNKTEEDFSTLEAFQDYEEEIEDIIYNLVHGIDKEKMEARIKEYQSSHVGEIVKKQSKLEELDKSIENQILMEEILYKSRIKELQEAMDREKKRKMEHSRQMNEVLMGERDHIELTEDIPITDSTSSLLNTLSAMTSLHPALLLFNQRPDPKPLSTTTTTTGKSSSTSSDVQQQQQQQKERKKPSLRSIWKAGGYNPIIHTKRNWNDIITGLVVTYYQPIEKRKKIKNHVHVHVMKKESSINDSANNENRMSEEDDNWSYILPSDESKYTHLIEDVDKDKSDFKPKMENQPPNNTIKQENDTQEYLNSNDKKDLSAMVNDGYIYALGGKVPIHWS